MLKIILKELKEHIPYTMIGAFSGILLMLLFSNIGREKATALFEIFHPLHVFLSALVTATLFKQYNCSNSKKDCSFWRLILVGYFGAIGIATISDSVIPFLGEKLLQMPYAKPHIGFIEQWPIVNGAALLGILLAFFQPQTKFPHLGHVLLSTWASLFHIMAAGPTIGLLMLFIIFGFLFLSVWLPCCFSDIVFPLLFVRNKPKK